MGGATNRRKGNKFETAVAAWLRPRLDLDDIVTSRDGRGGAQGGADLHGCDAGRWHPHVAGWALELKNVKRPSVPSWLDQAEQAAVDVGVEWYAVIHKTFGVADPGASRVYLPRRMLLDLLLYNQPTLRTYDHAGYLTLTLDEWAEVAS